jgi:hypothetical protein
MGPKPMISISSFLTLSGATSIELNKLVLDPAEVNTYIEGFKKMVETTSACEYAFVKLFHRSSNEDGTYDIKIKTFTQADNPRSSMTMINEHLQRQSFTVGKGNVVIEKALIKSIPKVPQTAERLEITKRTSFAVIDYEDWLLHIDLVKRLTNPAEFAMKLSNAKRNLVDTPLNQMDSSAYDFVRTSLLHLNPESPPRAPEVRDIVNDILVASSVGDKDTQQYQNEIYVLARDVFRDPMLISKFKQESGFKRLCANAVELSRPIYFKQVLPAIDTFFLTDKMDGMRAMLVINEMYRRHDRKRVFLGAEIKAIADRVYPISQTMHPTGSSVQIERTVLDVEMMTDAKGKHSFHCFDVIMIASKRMSNSPFKDRIRKFGIVNELLAKYELGGVKEFIRLTKDSFGQQIKAFYEVKRSYHIDGLIFTPQGMYFKDAIAGKKHGRTGEKYERVFNTDYASTVSFKWKPLDQMTIDFYMMANPKKQGSYMLCSGIDAKTFALLRMSFFEGYEAPVSPNSHKYFPIQFSASDGSFTAEWTPTADEMKTTSYPLAGLAGLAGLVGEFAFANRDNSMLQHPKLVRLRLDRNHDVELGQYYGNAFRYAELIWHSVRHPLTMETLCANSSADTYFAANDSDDWYKAQRNFNSFAKTYILEKFLYATASSKAKLIDVAAGKGQDLARAIDVGYEEIVALDRDVDALYEMLDRKYNLRVKRTGATATIHLKQMDLEDTADTTIAKLNIPRGAADSVMINFAIHYICHSAYPARSDPLVEFAKLCSFYLKPGGRVMITAFDGEEVFKLFADQAKTITSDTQSTWSVNENNRLKYSIKRMYSSDELMLTDQAIDVLLPFSAGEYYREFLVNYGHVQQVFEQQGFTLATTDSFGSLLRMYKKENTRGFAALTEADRQYVSLYGYQVFEKK